MKEASCLGPVILDIAGYSLTQEERALLQHPQVGGVIFFSRNYDNPKQLHDLVTEIRECRSPILLCVDQEGGRVQRFLKGFTRLPPLEAMGNKVINGKVDSKISETTKKMGRLMAMEVRALGIDLSFAPVLDLNTKQSAVIGERAFHAHPQVVCDLASAYIAGMQEVGMQAVGKHFPGHGSVAADSHFVLPEDKRAFFDILPDLYPFATLIKQGLPGIMPAHIWYSKIAPQPVGFSFYWLNTVLRQHLGFQGVIVSDDLSMEGGAIGGYAERARRALEAGCNYILICNNREGVITVLENEMPKVDNAQHLLRMRLLAKKEAVQWNDLKYCSLWQEAHSSIHEYELIYGS